MQLFFIIIQVIGCFSSVYEPQVVIQLGEYTNLISLLNKNNINLSYIGWGGKDKNGNQFKKVKFNEFKNFTINNIHILQIKNMNEDDKKSIFSCGYFSTVSGIISNDFKNLNSSTFINHLSSDNINIKYILNNTYLTKININFNKIFPIPKCFVKINDINVFFKNNIQNKTLDYLYYQVNLSMTIEKIDCLNKIEIICTLLNQNFTINTKNNICLNIDTTTTTTTTTLSSTTTPTHIIITTPIPTFINTTSILNIMDLKNSTNLTIILSISIGGLFLIVVIILIVCIYCKIKSSNKRKDSINENKDISHNLIDEILNKKKDISHNLINEK